MKCKDEVDCNPYVFVVGCARSGTTLLQRMLDSHPMLAVANDAHLIFACLDEFAPQSIPDAIAGKDILLTENLAAGVRQYRRFYRLGLSQEQAEQAAEEAKTYADYLRILYSRFATRSGKPFGGDKTPTNVRCLPLLHGLFPEARTVHIIRDGRDVTLSALEWAQDGKGPGKLELWEIQPVAVSALWWRWQVKCGRYSGAQLKAGRYLEVCYEDLVQRTEESLRRITEFLELPYSAQMEHFHLGKVRYEPGLSAKKAWLPPTPDLRKWRAHMAEADIELFEALAGDLLHDLGYERAFRTISPTVVKAAVACKAWWDSMLLKRVWPRQNCKSIPVCTFT